MELKHSHIAAAAAFTLLICAATWMVALKKLSPHRVKAKAEAVQAQAAPDWHPKPEEAESLLDEIIAPDETEPAAPAANARQTPQKRDWAQIKASGKLRVAMMPRQGPEGISSGMTPEDSERALLSAFAKENELGIERVVVRRFEELQAALLEGRCDTIAASFAITPERQKLYKFSKPFRHTIEQIAVSASSKANSLQDLYGKQGAIQPGTSYVDSMKALAAKHKGLVFAEAPEGLEPEVLFARVASGRYAYTVAEDSYLASHLEKRRDLKTLYSFPGGRDIAWPVRNDAPELLDMLNSYLERFQLAESQPSASAKARDLREIKKRGFLRIITRNNPYCYFIHRGRAMGFEYELAAEFAKEQGLVPIMIVPPEWDDMRDWLLQGKGDIIAANMTATPGRLADGKMHLAGRYGGARQMIVGRASEKPFSSLNDLRGRKVCVRRSSSFWETLEGIRRGGVDFKMEAMPENLETCEILDKVAKGECDLSVADEAMTNAEILSGSKLKELAPATKELYYCWGLRDNVPELQKACEDYLRRQSRPPSYRSAFFNIIFKKYYMNSATVAAADMEMARGPSLTLSPYDQLFKRYSARYGMDWRLIAAQSFQESQFDPNATSYLGTQGLMQMMPGTASDLGFRNLRDPETGIHAGVRFLRMQMERFNAAKLSETDMACFALAAYNAGFGHVLDARIIAEDMGLNPDVWFGNVEEGLKRLSDPKVAAKARYGYCRSSETIGYVRGIMARYKHYAEMIEMKKAKDAVKD